MKPVDRYIQDVMASVFAAPGERERFEADLRAHFTDAKERGETPPRIIRDMGKPEDVAAAFNGERSMQFAGFWERLVAFVGDFGVMLALLVIPAAAVLALFGRWGVDGGRALGVTVTLVAAGVAFVGLALFYFPLLEWRFGKTFGKHLMRIRVVRESGAPIGLGQAFVRRLSYYFEMLVIDALFIPFTDKKQRALDIIAKTVVAREPGEQAPWWSWVVCLALPVVCVLALFAIATLFRQG